MPRCRVLAAGFPCTAASPLNIHRGTDEYRQCVEHGDLSTGSVFQALVGLALRHREALELLVLEHVPQLASPPNGGGPSDLDAVVQALNMRVGLYVKVWELCPKIFGWPQARKRLWMLGVKRERLQSLGMDEAEAGRKLTDMMNRLAGSSLTPIDQVLLPDAHEVIDRWCRQAFAHKLLMEGDTQGSYEIMGGLVPPPKPKHSRKKKETWQIT